AKSPLPDVEALGAGSDFRPFMAQGVPDDVRNRALRKLWRSNPLYARIDMLDDYCEDYTDARCAVPGVASLYRVGRGFAEEMVRADEEGAPRDEASSENETSEDPSGDEEPRKESTKTTRDA
ncbi:MAG: DUF3306 domain-containing protein, partial [Geminicoccaceae bacterium]|nr:DUF3306 domain-containing protein [Geminicoccaceae bacterium]